MITIQNQRIPQLKDYTKLLVFPCQPLNINNAWVYYLRVRLASKLVNLETQFTEKDTLAIVGEVYSKTLDYSDTWYCFVEKYLYIIDKAISANATIVLSRHRSGIESIVIEHLKSYKSSYKCYQDFYTYKFVPVSLIGVRDSARPDLISVSK